MIDKDKIRPIPQSIAKKIRKLDEGNGDDGYVRCYAYLARMGKELVKITVACKSYKKQWFCKQVAVHGVHSDECLVRDMEYCFMGYSFGWYLEGISQYHKDFEDGKWHRADDKFYDPKVPVVNKGYALTFNEYKYSVLNRYPYNDVIKYLRVYEQFPQAEYFIKLGLQHLATNKTLLKKAASDKSFRKWLIRNAKLLRNEYGNFPYFPSKVIQSAYKRNMTLLEMQRLEREGAEALRDYSYKNTISRVIPEKEILSLLDYIKAQHTSLDSYADYIRACLFLNLDMSLPKNRYPHDFKRWHDIRIDEYKTARALKDEEERKEMYRKFALIAEKYLPMQRDMKDAFIVVIAHSPADLIREGDMLHHCVGRMNYDQRFIREESLIFFIRNKETPDVPFVTMEYSLKNGKVLQCYGDHDTRPSEEVLNFVNRKWLPYAHKKLKTITAAA